MTVLAYFSWTHLLTLLLLIPLSNFSFVLIIIVRLFAWRDSHHSNEPQVLFALLILPHFYVSRCFFDSSRLHFGHPSFPSFPFDLLTSSSIPLSTPFDWSDKRLKLSTNFFFLSQNFNSIRENIEKKNFFLLPKRSCTNNNQLTSTNPFWSLLRFQNPVSSSLIHSKPSPQKRILVILATSLKSWIPREKGRFPRLPNCDAKSWRK